MDAITQAHYNLGIAYLNEKQYTEAIAAFQKAITLDADFAEAHGQLGLAYFELDRFDEAGAAAKEAIRLNPNYQPALKILDELKQEHYDSGIAFLTEEEYESALAAFKAAIEIDSGFIEAHHAQGLAYLGTGKLDMAKQMAEAALRLDANYEPAQTLLNAIKPPPVPPRPTAPTEAPSVNAGQTSSPETSVQTPITEPIVVQTPVPETHPLVIPLQPEEPDAQPSPSEKEKHYEQGIAFLNNGQYDLAIAAFKSAKNLDANYRDAHYGLGLAYFRVGALDVSEVATREALQIDSSFLPAHQLLDTIDAQDAAAKNRRLWRRVAGAIGVVGIALIAFAAFRLGFLDSWLNPEPPKLSITKVTLSEPTGDGFLDAGESGRILITVQNSGGDVRNVQLKLDPGFRAGLRYQPVLTLARLAGNDAQTLTIPIAAESGIQAQNVEMNIDVIDKNGMPLASKPFSFKTQPVPLSPQPVR